MGASDVGEINEAAPIEQKRPGFIGRIRQQPGGSKALLAFGASLLSSKNFGEGFGNGALAYQDVLDTERDKLKPKFALTKDGNFSYSQDPTTGEVVMKRTAAADFEEGQNTMKLQNTLAALGIREKGDTARQDNLLGYRREADKMVDGRLRDFDQSDTDRNNADNANALKIAQIDAANRLAAARITAASSSNKPTSAAIQKQVGDYTTVRDSLDNATQQLDPILQSIDNGSLQFSLASNMRHKAAIGLGVGGNEETVLYSQFQTSLESLRNALLVANKGVQTDGDADRAMAELIAGQGNTATVKANMHKVVDSIRRRSAQANGRITDLSNQYQIETGASQQGAYSGAPAPAPSSRPAPRSGTTRSGTSWRVVP
jgi:hypothetical protein